MKRYTIKPAIEKKPFRIDYERELNPQQLEVVMAPSGPILVIAGAGSGKTRVVTFRVARLIESGVDPSRILLLTFTNKAAKEMLHRVEHLLSIDTRSIWGGTFHHTGNLILRRHSEILGFKSNFTILDSEDSKELLETCIAELGIETKKKRFPKGEVLRDISGLSINREKSIEEILDERYPYFLDLHEEIQSVLTFYKKKKFQMNAMDFDDLLLYWRHLLENHPDILNYYANRFLHILVDEYQDTNKLQADIVDLLASTHRNLMVVGDDSQSIYSFRGAHFSNIIDFPSRYPDCKIFKLEINYRSTPQILSLANSSISNNKRQFKKRLVSVRKDGPLPAIVSLRDPSLQAEFVAQRILELRENGIPFNEIAVLYRAHYQSMELQMELTRRGIPYEVRSGIRFFEQAHIKDIVSFLRFILNPHDELSFKRILKIYPGLGPSTAERLWNLCVSSNNPIEALKSNDSKKIIPKMGIDGYRDFLETIDKLTKCDINSEPSPLIEIILEGGYIDYLISRYPNAESRLEDIEQLSLFAKKFKNLESLLSELSLMSAVAAEDIAESEAEDERVVLSSIHQAKGLEWGVVFIIYLAEGRMPSAKGLRDPEGEEEERRLFYVGTTRAKDELYLCYPLMGNSWERGGLLLKPSRFIQELPENVYEEWIVEEK